MSSKKRSAAAKKGWETRRARGGAALRPGEESADSGVVLVPQRQDPEPAAVDGISVSTRCISASFVLDFNAGVLVDEMAKAFIGHHLEAISNGRHPRGGGQRPLSEGRRNDPGRESKYRGYNSGHLAENLRRGKITGTTAKAKTRILPPTDRNVFLANEEKRGITYLSTEGEAGEAATAAGYAAVELLLLGKKVDVDRGGAD